MFTYTPRTGSRPGVSVLLVPRVLFLALFHLSLFIYPAS